MYKNEYLNKLKQIFRYWFIINGELIVFKNFLEVCKYYNLPDTTTTGTLLDDLKVVVDFQVLF